jgi:hypothetical protein
MRTTFIALLAAATISLLAVPAAHGQAIPRFYSVSGASGTYDVQTRYVSPTQPDCPGSYEDEEHADFRQRTSPARSGGALMRGVGTLVLGAGGGYDGVHRDLNCSGVLSSCEHHFGWQPDGGALITLTFTAGGARVAATLSKTRVLTDNCPLGAKNGFFLGRDRVSRAERRRGRFTLRFRQSQVIRRDGVAIGSRVSRLTVTVRRRAG